MLATVWELEKGNRMKPLKGVAVGAGYFSQFHFDAWSRIEGVQLTAVCDVNAEVAAKAAAEYGIAQTYVDYATMLDAEQPDFVDIITRPDSHLSLVTEAASRGIPIICQKALAPTFAEAQQIVQVADLAGVPLMVHENFRFQPWYREIRRQINTGAIGDRLHSISFQCRLGDGWQHDAYMERQPCFREMPRLLIFETGVHFVDCLREGREFETSGHEYLKSLAVVEAIYESADSKVPMRGLSGDSKCV